MKLLNDFIEQFSLLLSIRFLLTIMAKHPGENVRILIERDAGVYLGTIQQFILQTTYVNKSDTQT